MCSKIVNIKVNSELSVVICKISGILHHSFLAVMKRWRPCRRVCVSKTSSQHYRRIHCLSILRRGGFVVPSAGRTTWRAAPQDFFQEDFVRDPSQRQSPFSSTLFSGTWWVISAKRREFRRGIQKGCNFRLLKEEIALCTRAGRRDFYLICNKRYAFVEFNLPVVQQRRLQTHIYPLYLSN